MVSPVQPGFFARIGNPTAARRLITFAFCVLVVVSLVCPYISYVIPTYTPETAAEALREAQAVYDAEMAAYEVDMQAQSDARALIAEVEPVFNRVTAELKTLQQAETPDTAATEAKQAEYDLYNNQIIEARKITRKASTIAEPVAVQDPAPATDAAVKSAGPGELKNQGVSGLSLMTGGLSAAIRTGAYLSLIPGVILLFAAAVLSLFSFPLKWRRPMVLFGGMLVVFSALRITTATAKELGAIAKVYSFSFGYMVAIICSLLAILSVIFEEKRFDLSFKGIVRFASDKAIYLVLLALVLVIAIIRPKFLSVSTLLNILQQSSTRLIIAMGMSFVIIGTGGVDLSCGRVVGMTAVISGSMIQTSTYSRLFFPDLPQLPVVLPLLIATVIALVFGLINGVIVAKLSVPPFITTLATQVIVYGATSIYFDMAPNNSQPIGGLREDFTSLGSGAVYGFIPIVVIIALVVCLTIWFVQNKTVFGKNVFAIGGNREAAKVSGINVTVTIIAIFALASLLIGLAGVLEAARTGGATNNYGLGYELDAIAACVVGGVSSSGGVGTVGGIVSGVLIFQVINYGLTFLGVNPYWQQIIKGVIIASAVALDIRKYLSKK